MNELGVEIELDDFVAEVGGRFTGRVIRYPDADGITTKTKARKLDLSLWYETSGRGTTNKEAVASQEFVCDSHGGVNGVFSLDVPFDGPVSYDGSLIRLRWEVRVRLDLKLARDPKHEVAVLVVPRNGYGIYDRPHPLRS